MKTQSRRQRKRDVSCVQAKGIKCYFTTGEMTTQQERKNILAEKVEEGYSLLKEEGEQIPDRIYNALEGISSTLLAWKQNGGEKGWSQQLKDRKGHPLYSEAESTAIEALAEEATPLLNTLFDVSMIGGADLQNLKLGASSEIVKVPSVVAPQDISLDKLYYGTLKKLDDYDREWRDITSQIGLLKTFESQDAKGIITLPFVPPIPVPWVIPAKAKLPILSTILELLRIMVSGPVMDAPTYRQLLSLVLALLDLLRGEWKNALLSILGAFSKTAMWVGLGGKILRDAWLLIAPDLQHELQRVLFRSSKSLFAGFFLWAFSTFSPDVVRVSIQTTVDKLREVVANFNEKIEGVETQAKQVASTAGVDISFKRVPENLVPSLDDVQNLQTILRVPEVYCSTEFQKILQPLLLVPPLRLALELFNIPTVEEDIQDQCKGKQGSLSDTLAEKATPTISIIPGGPLDTLASAAETVQSAASGDLSAALPSAVPGLPAASVPTMPKIGGKSRTRKAKRFSGKQ